MAGEPNRAPGVVVLFGPPGSGKGTQALLLSRRMGVPAISTGDMLRQAVAAGSELGHRVASIMAAGMLVDDALMAEVVSERLARPDVQHGCLLDGYPRTRAQATTLDELLAARGQAVGRVVMIEVPMGELVRRAVLRQRGEDDRPEVVRERLAVYLEKTAPVAEHYRAKGLLNVVNGDQGVEDVTAALLCALGIEALQEAR